MEFAIHFTNSTREFNKSQAVCNHINSFYKKKFATIIEEDDDYDEEGILRDEIREEYEDKNTDDIED